MVKRVNNVCVSEIEDKEKLLVEKLLDEKKTITFAESCTGGLLSKKITDISGASSCFECGFVTYSNEKKEKLLGVSRETLKKYGAVSYQTAYEMCGGARKAADADIAIGVTGIAGPTGGTPEKPVGLVYVGVCTEKVWGVVKLNLSGTREEVREQTSCVAFDLALKALKGELSLREENPMMIEIQYI